MKGQTSMILIILVIFIIVGLGTFLLSFSQTISQSQYLNSYAHNLLLSIMRSDTGYDDPGCKQVRDVVACQFFTPSRTCGAGAPTCEQVAENLITTYMNSFELISENFRYLITVKGAGCGVVMGGSGIVEISIGEASLADERVSKYAANYPWTKLLSRPGCERDFAYLLDCQRDPNARPDCPQILADPSHQEAYNECLSCDPGSHSLKAQLILARK